MGRHDQEFKSRLEYVTLSRGGAGGEARACTRETGRQTAGRSGVSFPVRLPSGAAAFQEQ